MTRYLVGAAGLLLALSGCARKAGPEGTEMATLTVTSEAFADGGTIPDQYTCRGDDVNPPLSWSGGTGQEVAYALICDDPDAPRGTWTHWLVWNIPGTSLEANLAKEAAFSLGMSMGTNSWRKVGWGGPCPPSGIHHYHFKVYGLKSKLELGTDADAAKLMAAMRPLIVSHGELVGLVAAKP